MSTHPPTLSKPSVPSSGTDHDALPPGTRFGEFEILRVLGVGGFGIVYLAQDHSLEREVALKEYMPASLAARGAGPQITVRSSSFAETYAIGLRSFINEARLLARFDHPSLVKVYRFWEDNATAYMVMPFLQGITLRDARRGMPHAPDEAWIRSVLTPILSALELLHREGVYHRDIAPDNILLPRDGPPVLLDFGAARRVISDRTQSLTAILKPSYAPIEQYAEMTQLRQGPWTDIYALGAVVHYLLFGVPPAPATARAVQDDGDATETRIVPGVSPRFLEAMSWMLAIRPNQRPQSGEQLRAVLDGRAEIPPRGRPGVTVPGALAPSTGPQIEQVADATRINTAYLPTHLPTARVAPASDQRATTTFSPKAPMPTARQTPTEVPPQRPAGPPVPTATPPAATASPQPVRPAADQPPATTSQRPAPTKGASAPAAAAAPAARSAVTPPAGAQVPPPTGAQVPPSPARGGQNPAPAPLAATPAAASAKRHEGPPAQPASLQGREGPPSQPGPLAAPRRATLAAGIAPASSRAALAAGIVGGVASCDASARHRGSEQPAPGHPAAGIAAGSPRGCAGVAGRQAARRFEVMACPRRRRLVRRRRGARGLAVLRTSRRSPSASKPPPRRRRHRASSRRRRQRLSRSSSRRPIRHRRRSSTRTLPSRRCRRRPLPPPATPRRERRRPTVHRAPMSAPRAGRGCGRRASRCRASARIRRWPRTAASARRVRPSRRPRGAPNASVNSDRPVVPSTPPPRDYGTVQRPTAPAEYGGQSIRDVCKGSFFERNICLDQRCEEARFRSTPECVDVLNRKGKRQSQ